MTNALIIFIHSPVVICFYAFSVFAISLFISGYIWLLVSNIFLYFHPYLGKIPILTNIFQGLKPPTSKPL